MRYTTLGDDVLDTLDYSIIATAKTNEIAESIAAAMNAAQQSGQRTASWVCKKCGYRNDTTHDDCHGCGEPRR